MTNICIYAYISIYIYATSQLRHTYRSMSIVLYIDLQIYRESIAKRDLSDKR